jgi:protein-disulfide isomerase
MLAEGSVCAYEQNKFWQFHDIAFESENKISRSTIINIASEIGLDLNQFNSCLESGRGLEVVKEDINTAIKARIRSTPTLLINGRMLRGVPKPLELNEILRYAKKHLPPPK